MAALGVTALLEVLGALEVLDAAAAAGLAAATAPVSESAWFWFCTSVMGLILSLPAERERNRRCDSAARFTCQTSSLPVERGRWEPCDARDLAATSLTVERGTAVARRMEDAAQERRGVGRTQRREDAT